jgi:hypothetical protein
MKISLAPFGLATIVAMAWCSSPAHAQASTANLSSQFAAWTAANGEEWRLRPEPGTGYARMLFGGSARLDAAPAETDSDYLTRARAFVALSQGLLGSDLDTLVDDSVVRLPLANVGTTNKVAAILRQEVAGVPVEDGWIHALLTEEGDLLALDNQTLPGLSGFDVHPALGARDAETLAVAAFLRETGLSPTRIGTPRLVIERVEVDGKSAPALAWQVEVANLEPGYEPEGIRYSIAAAGAPSVVAREASVHFFDVGGTVQAMTTPSNKPDGAGNPPTNENQRYLRVTSSAGTVFADASGNFNFAGATGPLSCTFTFVGSFANVMNSNGGEYSLVQSLTGTGNMVVMNPTPSEQLTSQANAYARLQDCRDYIKAVNPADIIPDFAALANVNISSTCNAFYDGASTNYYLAGGGCPNTAYSTVVGHEQGHWYNDLYGSGNGFDGFGEGASDVWCMYEFDTNIVGEDFLGPGVPVRDGENTRQYCGDGNGGCYGEVHDDGEVLMGVLWKVRRNLNNSLGDALGDATSDALNVTWFEAYNQGTIDSIIEIQWLTLDDDDADINNGTPNYSDIDAAFLEQGFPGFALDFVGFANIDKPATTPDEVGPYGVSADVTPLIGSSISSATLNYSVDGGGFTAVPMENVSGATWVGLIPGQPSPSEVAWYISASDDNGNSETTPGGAPGTTNPFKIGLETVYFSDDFESVGDNGWSHGGAGDDWQRGTPVGLGGSGGAFTWADPTAAVSGTKVWGNDLTTDGNYLSNASNMLTSPSIDLSGASGTKLRYSRWLSVETATFDQATTSVNGTQLFANGNSTPHIDTDWAQEEFDIGFADGNAATQLVFDLTSNGTRNLGGWNVDDVSLFSFQNTPAVLPTNYGAGLAGSSGVIPGLDSAGQPAQVGNAQNEVVVKNAKRGATAYLGAGQTSLSFPIFGGTLLVLPDVLYLLTVDVYGQAQLALPIPNDGTLAGQVFYFQAFVVDANSAGPFAMTPGLSATIIP